MAFSLDCEHCQVSFVTLEARLSHSCAGVLVRNVATPTDSAVNHPAHYTAHPSGIECIQITEHMGFNLGNAVKYIWRADLKYESAEQDLEKAIWYLQRELQKRKGTPKQ